MSFKSCSTFPWVYTANSSGDKSVKSLVIIGLPKLILISVGLSLNFFGGFNSCVPLIAMGTIIIFDCCAKIKLPFLNNCISPDLDLVPSGKVITSFPIVRQTMTKIHKR